MINLKEIKKKIILKNNIYSLLIILIVFFLDRYTKIFILNNFNESTFYLNEFVNFDLVWNTGIGFGLLSFKTENIYNFITIIIGLVIFILLFICLTSTKIDKIAFSMICGGALGNFYDRMVYKAVPDFIDLHLENFHWFTFNLADIFITLGILIYLIRGILIKEV